MKKLMYIREFKWNIFFGTFTQGMILKNDGLKRIKELSVHWLIIM